MPSKAFTIGRRWTLAVATLAAFALPAEAQTEASTQPPLERPRASAQWVAQGPVIDGDVLGEPLWARARPASGFWQTTPDEGQPASQRTEVFVLYTDSTLYFGVVCYDDDPSTIIVADSRRDSSLEETAR